MTSLEEVLELSGVDERVCPIGQKWKQFYELLCKQSSAPDRPMPPPFLGADWWKTSDEEKAERLAEQLRWCAQNGLLDHAHRFMVSLRAADWHRRARSVRSSKVGSEYRYRRVSRGTLNDLAFVRDAVRDIPGIGTRPRGGIGSFCARVGYALSLGFREKEIVAFGLLQWAAIGSGYLLWAQMLDWIPEEVWRSAIESGKGSVVDLVLLAWSFVCVGLVAYPVGILSGCMGAAHFLHRQGKESTFAACLSMVVPQSWALWGFHWIDGWVTVRQILDRLPRNNGRSPAVDRATSEALYHAWKLGIAGVLPAVLTGRGLLGAGIDSIGFVKAKFVEVATLRSGYSAFCWGVGVLAYLATLCLFMVVDVVPPGQAVYGYIYEIYLWAAVPIMVSLSVIMLFLRPIYILSICDLYSDYLQENAIAVSLPDAPHRATRALFAFLVLCIIVSSVFLFREELGISAMLNAPDGQNHLL
jgi:hypothetical protein